MVRDTANDDSDQPTHTSVTIKGSCHCGRVAFTVESFTPYPFMVCHCTADTKTAGLYTSNIMGEFATLHLSGTDPNMAHSVYRASIPATDSTPASLSTHERHFCCMCGSALWAYDSRWPESIYPFATAIDTPTLPSVPIKDQIHIFTGFRKDYSPPIPANVEAVHCFGGYPDIGIAEWHKKHGRYGTFSPPSDS